MPFVQFVDYELHYDYRKSGNKPVLIFANSLGSDLHLWDAQANFFSPHYNILRYDKRGHGKSTAPSGSYSIEGLAEDVVGLMDHLDIEKADFVGISIGGMIGQILGAVFPERFGKMVLACTTSCQHDYRVVWEERIRMAEDKGMDSVAKITGERWFTREFRENNPELLSKIENMVRETHIEGYVGCCKAIRKMDLRSTHGSIKNPVLIIAGAYDVATPPEQGREIHRNVPNAKWKIIFGPHIVNLEKEAEFNEELADFLGLPNE